MDFVSNLRAGFTSALSSPTPLVSGEPLHKRPASDGPQLKYGLNDFASLTVDQAKQLRFGKNTDATVSLLAALGKPIDDRGLQLEKVVEMLQSMPLDSAIADKLGSGFLSLLWQDLPHPPSVLVGAEQRFRTADGSNTNIWQPDLGKAGQPYSRTVTPLHPMPHNLPDPGLVFDSLLRRQQFTPHPSGISSFMFAFATLIIHDIFRTSRADPTINETSGYVDLSVLYGNNQEEQDKVRTKVNGLMKPDTAAEDRLFMLPPAVAALLVLFSRNHNFIAQRLLAVNERDQYKEWEQLDEEGKRWQDEELFNTARLINNTYFIRIVLHDYLRSILGLTETPSGWILDPAKEIRNMSGEVPRATGNVSSIEFNFLYRWHSTISASDAKWTEGVFAKFFPGRDAAEISPIEFMGVAHQIAEEQGTDPSQWKIGELERDENGYFPDDKLAAILAAAIEEPAGAFKARGSPPALKCIDVAGMAAARTYHRTCSLNEFRRYLKLKEFESFEEWNSDKEIARAAEALYKSVDNLELYPGLLAEERKPSMIGSGLAPGYTVSRAILSDAVALVRGDRFLTTQNDTATLTYHGYADAAANVKNGAYGGMLPKVLFRTLPGVFKPDSVYANFPMQTPECMRKNLTKIGVQDKYDFRRPQVPAPETVTLDTQHAILSVANDQTSFEYLHTDAALEVVGHQVGIFPSFDDPVWSQHQRELADKVFFHPGWAKSMAASLSKYTDRLLSDASYQLSTKAVQTVDIVYDVLNIAPIYWIAEEFGISLKTKRTPHGIWAPKELLTALQTLHHYLYFNNDATESFELREKALKYASRLRTTLQVPLAESRSWVVRNTVGRTPLGLSHTAAETYDRVIHSGYDTLAEQTAIVLGLLVSFSSHLGATQSRILNQLLPNAFQPPIIPQRALPHAAQIEKSLKAGPRQAAKKLLGEEHHEGDEHQKKPLEEQPKTEHGKNLTEKADTKHIHAARPPRKAPTKEQMEAMKDGQEKAEQLFKGAVQVAAEAAKNPARLQGLLFESLRMDPPRTEIRRRARADGKFEGKSYSHGDLIVLGIESALKDPENFPSPAMYDLNRDFDSYRLIGWATSRLVENVYGAIISKILLLPNVRRASGNSGKLHRFPEYLEKSQVKTWRYIDSFAAVTPFPASMLISYDEAPVGGV